MEPRRIDRFFHTLAKHLKQPATVILTGAAAGSLFGHVRPSADVDFGIRLTHRRPMDLAAVERAMTRTIEETGIPANYAEEIGRWSSVSLLDYRRHVRFYRRVGSIRVYLLDPAYWSIGKVARYLESDILDLVAVLRAQKVPARRLIILWAKALRASPLSPALTAFREQAEAFLRSHGRTVWGKRFDPNQAIADLRRRLMASRPSRR